MRRGHSQNHQPATLAQPITFTYPVWTRLMPQTKSIVVPTNRSLLPLRLMPRTYFFTQTHTSTQEDSGTTLLPVRVSGKIFLRKRKFSYLFSHNALSWSKTIWTKATYAWYRAVALEGEINYFKWQLVITFRVWLTKVSLVQPLSCL